MSRTNASKPISFEHYADLCTVPARRKFAGVLGFQGAIVCMLHVLQNLWSFFFWEGKAKIGEDKDEKGGFFQQRCTPQLAAAREAACAQIGIWRGTYSFLWRSMSSRHSVTFARFGCAVKICSSPAVVILDQINAIFAPNPNRPRACLTPYFVPDNTRPNISGTSSCRMPLHQSSAGCCRLEWRLYYYYK